ncbi:MAG: glutathione peroxidase [Gammaproteobacteria bacterium]|nr:glutathione peroxidase [Gammaproteobacteria bacterium]
MNRLFAVVALAASSAAFSPAAGAGCPGFLDQDVRKLRSTENINICREFAGKPILIVNTASRCGFTPQFEGLERLHQAYRDRGLAVVGVPSDDFQQAAPDEETAAQVCFVNYGVTFTMLSQQKVLGPDAHPMFRELGRRAGEPSWNFNKYLVDRQGNVVERFDSRVEPMSDRLRESVESVL